jgi:hypothetical protein
MARKYSKRKVHSRRHRSRRSRRSVRGRRVRSRLSKKRTHRSKKKMRGGVGGLWSQRRKDCTTTHLYYVKDGFLAKRDWPSQINTPIIFNENNENIKVKLMNKDLQNMNNLIKKTQLTFDGITYALLQSDKILSGSSHKQMRDANFELYKILLCSLDDTNEKYWKTTAQTKDKFSYSGPCIYMTNEAYKIFNICENYEKYWNKFGSLAFLRKTSLNREQDQEREREREEERKRAEAAQFREEHFSNPLLSGTQPRSVAEARLRERGNKLGVLTTKAAAIAAKTGESSLEDAKGEAKDDLIKSFKKNIIVKKAYMGKSIEEIARNVWIEKYTPHLVDVVVKNPSSRARENVDYEFIMNNAYIKHDNYLNDRQSVPEAFKEGFNIYFPKK